MLKEVSKLAIALLVLTACSGEHPDKAAADTLVAEASTALDRGDYQKAEQLLDSLSATYPKQIEAGRAALGLRPRVMERKTEQEITDLQVQIIGAKAYADSVGAMFKSVPASADVFEPYLIHKDFADNWRDRNTIVARLTPSGDFYVISSLSGTVGHNAVRLTAKGMTATTAPVKVDTTDRLSRESRRFSSEAADTIGALAMQADGSAATIAFVGGKSAPKAQLSAKELHALADTYRLSRALQQISAGNRRLEQLKAKLQLARDQAARTNE